MTDNKNIKALDNLHNRILNDTAFLTKVNHGELSALFHVKRILELQDAEIERLKTMHSEMCIGMKVLKRNAEKKFAERLKEKMFNYYECLSESAKGRPYKGDTLMDYEVVDMIEDCIENALKGMEEAADA